LSGVFPVAVILVSLALSPARADDMLQERFSDAQLITILNDA
jgi:hypothetical protein